MEDNKRLFIVSFGNSREYRMITDGCATDYCARHDSPLEGAETQIKEYLQERFPGQPLAFYTSAKVTEIDWKHRHEYDSYPMLDEEGVKEIEKVLERQVKVMEANDRLNDNALFDDDHT